MAKKTDEQLNPSKEASSAKDAADKAPAAKPASTAPAAEEASPASPSPSGASPGTASPGAASPGGASPGAASPDAASPDAASPTGGSPGGASSSRTSSTGASRGAAPHSTASPKDAGKKPGRPGRLLAATAFLLAVVAVVAVGYLYFVLIHLNPNAKLERDLARANAERTALQRSLSDAQEQWNQALTDSAAQTLETLQATEAGLLERLNQATEGAPPTERDWQLAEVEYLLRLANHRLPMERDVAGSLRLLRSADEMLAGLGDSALVGVRSALAEEILSLQQMQDADVQGLYLRLDALKGQLAELALAQPQFAAPPSAAVDRQPADFWEALIDEFRKLLRFRRVDAQIRPLMAPDEAVYLELNLRLMLEQAQLAVLKRDEAVFTSSLGNAGQWVGDHLDATDPRVQTLSTALAELRLVQLNRALPDISASLEALRKVRRSGQGG